MAEQGEPSEELYITVERYDEENTSENAEAEDVTERWVNISEERVDEEQKVKEGGAEDEPERKENSKKDRSDKEPKKENAEKGEKGERFYEKLKVENIDSEEVDPD